MFNWQYYTVQLIFSRLQHWQQNEATRLNTSNSTCTLDLKLWILFLWMFLDTVCINYMHVWWVYIQVHVIPGQCIGLTLLLVWRYILISDSCRMWDINNALHTCYGPHALFYTFGFIFLQSLTDLFSLRVPDKYPPSRLMHTSTFSLKTSVW